MTMLIEEEIAAKLNHARSWVKRPGWMPQSGECESLADLALALKEKLERAEKHTTELIASVDNCHAAITASGQRLEQAEAERDDARAANRLALDELHTVRPRLAALDGALRDAEEDHVENPSRDHPTCSCGATWPCVQKARHRAALGAGERKRECECGHDAAIRHVCSFCGRELEQ